MVLGEDFFSTVKWMTQLRDGGVKEIVSLNITGLATALKSKVWIGTPCLDFFQSTDRIILGGSVELRTSTPILRPSAEMNRSHELSNNNLTTIEFDTVLLKTYNFGVFHMGHKMAKFGGL
jgi:hypothetical protein